MLFSIVVLAMTVGVSLFFYFRANSHHNLHVIFVYLSAMRQLRYFMLSDIFYVFSVGRFFTGSYQVSHVFSSQSNQNVNKKLYTIVSK